MSNKILKLDQAQTLYQDLRERIDALPTSEDLSDKVAKSEIDNAGISGYTYSTKFGGEFTVTTATTSGYSFPYARAAVTGIASKHKLHRVTVNGTEYILSPKLWFKTTGTSDFKVYTYLGKLSLYVSNTTGVPGTADNVPFLIFFDINDKSSIDVITQTAGTYTIKIEEMTPTQKELPKSLIYGDNYVPIEKNNSGGTYNGFSIGVNELKNTRGSIAIGYTNSLSHEYTKAFGEANKITGKYGMALGVFNTVSGVQAIAIGSRNTASGLVAIAEGSDTTASGANAHSEGYETLASGAISHAEGNGSMAEAESAHAEGIYSTASGAASHAEGAYGTASGRVSHTEGEGNIAAGADSHAEGLLTIANGAGTHVSGIFNQADTVYDAWAANTSYSVGDRVFYNYYGYECITANSDATWTAAHWKNISHSSDKAVIVGNGISDSERSNAFALTWEGDGKYAGDVYVHANADSTGGTKLATIEDIPDIPVQDVQVNGVSVLSNGTANIPIANNQLGAVKVPSGYGIYINPRNGEILISSASEENIKEGENIYRPISANKAYTAAFYGLAKAAGDITQSQSDNNVGTYTNEAKVAINNMIGSVSKESLENAGITSKTYSTKFGGEFSVTTATETGWLNPHARASVTGRINKENMHRVTFNGTEYILRTRLWYNTNSGIKVYEYLGNLGLYIEDITGVPGGTDNVPFIIISDLNNSSSIDVVTQTAGTYTILVEQINPTKIDLPKSLIWGNSYVPIEKNNNGGTYNGFSFGVNELNNKRATFAIGYGNKIENEFSTAIGLSNKISGINGYAIGISNQISGSNGYAIGQSNNVSNNGIAIGDSLDVNSLMVALGKHNVAANTTFPDWAHNTQYHKGDIVYAVYNPSSSATSPRFAWMCIIDHTSPSSGTFFNNYSAGNWTLAPSTGDTAFVIGNGNNMVASNAMKVDWVGNTYLGGNLYTNCDNNSTNGVKVATVNDILVNDVQVNGTSILSNGVANIPIGSATEFGVFKRGSGLYDTNGVLGVNTSTEENIKNGSGGTFTTVSKQHVATFYGLAKAAGSDEKNSTLPVGQYTESAKSAISEMLNGSVSVSGTTPTINALPGIRYICGEVTTIDIATPASGIIDVVFTSGSTPAVLTVTPPTGMTMKWANGFDPDNLEADTTYEINIADGCLGVAGTWS